MELQQMIEALAADVSAFKTEAAAITADGEAKARAVADITARIDAIQAEQRAVKAAQAEVERRQAELERSASRPSAGGADDAEMQARKTFDGFLRRNNGREGNGSPAKFEIRAMSTNIGPEGGYVVLPQFSTDLITRIFDMSPVRAHASVVSIGEGNSLSIVVNDGRAGAGWLGEGQIVAATATPTFSLKTIPVAKNVAYAPATQEQLEDAFFDVESWLLEHISSEIARQEGTAFVNGDGVNKPRGFMTLATTTDEYESDKLGQVKSGDADDLTVEGFTRLYAALRTEHHANAIFAMHRTAFGDLLSLNSDTTYHFLTMGINNGQLSMNVLGRPVVFFDDMPIVGSGTRPVAFGDFRAGYRIVDRVGLSILRDPYTSTGIVKFFVTKRTGGDVVNVQAIKTLLLATD